MKMYSIIRLIAACLVWTVVSQALHAQGTQAIISGTVSDSQGTLPGATVQVKNESTGFSAGTITNENGEYQIKQLPLGSPYNITVTFIGFGEQKKSGYTLNQGDMLRVDFIMKEETVNMAVVEVIANSLKNTIPNIGSSTSVGARDIARLPVNGRNFTSLADLSPLSTGSSLSGQLQSSTNFTIDGMTAKNPTSGGTTNRNGGPYSITMEAVREFAVATNQYDVTYGRSGGGTVSTVTKSGTNVLSGSAFMYGRTNWLSSPYDIRGNKRDTEFSTYQFGFTLGGPIIKNRAHFFAAWDHQADARPLYIADIKTSDDENRYNVTQASLDRYLDIARRKYGVGNGRQFGSFNKTQGTDAVFARIDWQLNATSLLTIRNNFVHDQNNLGLSDNSSINLYEVYGNVLSIDNSLLATLRSALSPRATNELKLQYLYTLEESSTGKELPSANIPRSIVERVASTTADGKNVNTTIQLGGQRYSPENFYNNVLHLVDNLYYTTNRFNYTVGADIMYTHMDSRYGSEANGRFYFNGLDNFEAMTPYRYVREVYVDPNQRVSQNIMNTGLYGQMQTKLFAGFDVTAGLRFDYTAYFDKGNFNQTVYDELGLRTDNGLNNFQVQPRLQITWDVNDKHADIIRLGGGIFASDINNYAMINSMVFDGTKMFSVDVQGNLVPAPDFNAYRRDPLTAPGMGLFNNPGIPKISTINMNGKDAKVPVVYKANFSYTHFFTDRFKMSLNGFTTLARNNYMYVDRNMVDQPYFRITAEANRGVYVPASSITANGITNWMEGRKTNRVGRVLELVSEGKVNQYAFVIDGTWRYYKDGEISLSYTWNDSKDNTSYNGNVANSATLSQAVMDDPRDLSRMTYSNNQFRHKVVCYGTLPTFWGVSAGVRYSGIGGTRYSLIVNGNINGDFVATNDLAYVYDPNNPATPEYLRTGINALLENPDIEKNMKTYLRKSFGKIAERNGGENGFYGVFDLRLSKKVKTWKKQYVDISADIFNVANLLNKEWGRGHNFSSLQALYAAVTGFDPVKQEFSYFVNPNAGATSFTGTPYQVQIGLRYGF